MMRIAALLFAFLALALSAPASAQTNACTMVSTGTFQDINVFSDCKRVTNNSGVTVCAVSNADASQWQSFYNNPPSGVTIGSCPPACGGYSYSGYCYYRAGDGQSCDTACSGRGGCHSTGTNLLMTQSHCTNVGNNFSSAWSGGTNNGGYTGCFIVDSKGTLYTYIDIDQTYQLCNWGTASGQTRICACNN